MNETAESDQLNGHEANSMNLIDPLSKINPLNRDLNQTSLLDRMVLITWTVKEVLKLRLLSLGDDSYVKKLHTIAGELNREDVCVPFILGLLAGLVFLIVLKVLRCCLARFCCRKSVNRIGGNYKGRLINKRNPLDETHLLLVSHQDLSDQEV